jgi:hypothetical protein
MAKRRFFRGRGRVLVLLVSVAAVIGVAACTPTKPPPPAPGLSVTDFTINNGPQGNPANAFIRDPAPQFLPLGPNPNQQFAVQSRNNSQFGLVINNAPAYANDGFYVELGKLSNLNEVVANVSGSSPVSINLWLDKGNNGQFFAWDANDVFTSLDGDAFGTAATGQAITVNDSSTVSDLSGIGGNFTLAQLKAGSATGITGNTKVAIWVGICCGNPPPPGSQSALVQSLTVNGVAVG